MPDEQLHGSGAKTHHTCGKHRAVMIESTVVSTTVPVENTEPVKSTGMIESAVGQNWPTPVENTEPVKYTEMIESLGTKLARDCGKLLRSSTQNRLQGACNRWWV